jgi:DNA modification methylase
MKPYWSSERAALYHGDALETLQELPAESVQCVVTSPPYFHIRWYDCEGEIGWESTVEDYIDRLVSVFRAVRRVLRKDGTLWINISDSYCQTSGPHNSTTVYGRRSDSQYREARRPLVTGFRRKEMLLIPGRLTIALQDDGWRPRSEIVWHKRNPLPETTRDRPSRDHEMIYLLTKAQHYYSDIGAIAEPVSGNAHGRGNGLNPKRTNAEDAGRSANQRHVLQRLVDLRRPRTVWSIVSRGTTLNHYAAYPVEVPRRCILVGSRPGDVILDPFSGSGTTGVAALLEDRQYIGVDLKGEYLDMSIPELESAALGVRRRPGRQTEQLVFE